MPRTPEERAAINRQNASKSTGPKTDAGKAASRRNSTKHGLRAEALALPNEDPAAVAARSDSWNDYYRPQSPAAQHLVNACVAATLLSDRCQRYHEAAVTKQIRDDVSAWEDEQEANFRADVALLLTDPATAARRLPRTGHGCRWMVERWEALTAALDGRGFWDAAERDEALQLQGLSQSGTRGKLDPEAWLQILFSAGCVETRSEALLDWIFDPDRVPDVYHGEFDRDDLPPADTFRRGLRATADAELADARAREAEYRARHGDDRAGVADCALILHDGPSARLFLRYHAEARTAFTRAYGSLVKALERDADGDTDTDAVSPNEANSARHESPVEPAEAVSPNEADPEPLTEPDPADLPIPAPGEDPLFDLLLEACGGPTRTAADARNDAAAPARQRLVG